MRHADICNVQIRLTRGRGCIVVADPELYSVTPRISLTPTATNIGQQYSRVYTFLSLLCSHQKDLQIICRALTAHTCTADWGPDCTPVAAPDAARVCTPAGAPGCRPPQAPADTPAVTPADTAVWAPSWGQNMVSTSLSVHHSQYIMVIGQYIMFSTS